MEEDIDKRLKAEQRKYKKLLEQVIAFRKPLSKDLADRCSFMTAILQDLESHIKENGVSEEYTNGKNQCGRKRTVELDVYINLIKCYSLLLRQVNNSVPDGDNDDDEVDVDKILREIKKYGKDV